MIAQTLVNLSAGSRARLSGIVAACDSCDYFFLEPQLLSCCQSRFSWSDDNGCDRDI
jgi:hypothetical protein